MHHRSHRWGRALIALLAVFLLATSCGNSDDDEDAAETTEVPSTTAGADDGATETTGPADDGATDTTTAADGERDTFVPIEGVPGVTDEEIAFAAIGTRSNNPLGTCVLDCYAQGIEAYFAWRNDEGGIYGRQLALADSIDDELARNLERAQDVAASNDYFGAFIATQVASGFATLDDAGVPTFVWGIHATEAANRDHIWGHTGVACGNCTNRVIPYLAREAGATTVGVLGYGVSENSKICAGSYRDSIELYSEDIGGVTVGYFNDDVAFGMPNGIGPEVTAMKDAGVDFVATCIDLNGMKTLAQELERQGMSDVVMHHPNTYNQQFVAEAGGIFDGDTVGTAFVPWEYEAGLEQQEKFLEYMAAAGNEPSELAITGWINADQAFQGLLLAGPDFDREKVTAARNSMTAESVGGMIVPVDWTRQHTPPTEGDPTNDYENECFTGVRIEDGAFLPLGDDPTTPWLCWSNETLDWSEPVPTAFD